MSGPLNFLATSMTRRMRAATRAARDKINIGTGSRLRRGNRSSTAKAAAIRISVGNTTLERVDPARQADLIVSSPAGGLWYRNRCKLLYGNGLRRAGVLQRANGPGLWANIN